MILSEEGLFLHTQTLRYHLVREKKNDPPIPESLRVERMLGIANDVVGILRLWKVRWVGIENYAMGAVFRAHQIGEVAGVVKSQLWLAMKLVADVVPPAQARKHVLGYGAAKKQQIVEVVRDGLGYPIGNDHEADAGVVARFTFDKKVAEEREIAR